VQKKKRDQSNFRFIGYQGCTGTKQLEGKKQIILPINNKGISHIKGEEIIIKKIKKKLAQKKKTHTHLNTLSNKKKHQIPYLFLFT
jgi:hypothetical protein